MTKQNESAEFFVQLPKMLQRIAVAHGATLQSRESLMPLALECNAKTPFDRGVLACVVHVYALACQVPECRQAISDLGFEPFLQDIEGPGSGRRDD